MTWPPPIKIALADLPRGATFVMELASRERIYTHSGNVYAVQP